MKSISKDKSKQPVKPKKSATSTILFIGITCMIIGAMISFAVCFGIFPSKIKIIELEAEVAKLKAEASPKDTKISGLKTKVDGLEAETSQKDSEIIHLQTEIAALKAESSIKNNKITEIETQMVDKDITIQDIQKKLTKVLLKESRHEIVSKMEKELESCRASNNRCNNELQTNEDEIHHLGEVVESLRNEIVASKYLSALYESRNNILLKDIYKYDQITNELNEDLILLKEVLNNDQDDTKKRNLEIIQQNNILSLRVLELEKILEEQNYPRRFQEQEMIREDEQNKHYISNINSELEKIIERVEKYHTALIQVEDRYERGEFNIVKYGISTRPYIPFIGQLKLNKENFPRLKIVYDDLEHSVEFNLNVLYYNVIIVKAFFNLDENYQNEINELKKYFKREENKIGDNERRFKQEEPLKTFFEKYTKQLDERFKLEETMSESKLEENKEHIRNNRSDVSNLIEKRTRLWPKDVSESNTVADKKKIDTLENITNGLVLIEQGANIEVSELKTKEINLKGICEILESDYAQIVELERELINNKELDKIESIKQLRDKIQNLEEVKKQLEIDIIELKKNIPVEIKIEK